uniref:Cathepsin L n=1 Tax=Aceria tosichella TaxID=561515 RepID=A0A6G1S8K2_9ACAR
MKASILLVLVCLAAISELVLARRSSLHEWRQYKRQHGKIYETPEEEGHRFSLFLATKEYIRQHNTNDQVSYKLGLNHMADWTQEERASLKGLRYDPIEHERRLEASRNDPFLQAILDDPAPVPAEVDWRKVPNRVTEVKDQGQCGGCWAFASTGVLEGQQVVRNFTKTLVPLSEQDLIDCSQQNMGCDGGLMSLAFSDVESTGGIENEIDYPFKGDDGVNCSLKKDKIVMTDSGSVDLPQHNEQIIKATVSKYGPVSTGIFASPKFQYYTSGVFNDPDCNDKLDHAVLIVGYGKDPKEGDFWIVKNSWSDAWGDKGYIKMKFGICGIGKMSTIAKFDK